MQFRQVHREDGGRIRYQRVCSIDGEQVAYDDIAKGYETEDGQMVVLTDEDLAELPVSSSREIAVEKFVPADQIDPMLLEKSYYLEPEKGAAKPYALLRDALKAADRMALVHGLDPQPDDGRGAAGARRRHRDADHALAGRGPASPSSPTSATPRAPPSRPS